MTASTPAKRPLLDLSTKENFDKVEAIVEAMEVFIDEVGRAVGIARKEHAAPVAVIEGTGKPKTKPRGKLKAVDV